MKTSALQAVKGMNDILPASVPRTEKLPDSGLWQWFEDSVRIVMRRYGYQYLLTPIVEPTALFVRGWCFCPTFCGSPSLDSPFLAGLCRFGAWSMLVPRRRLSAPSAPSASGDPPCRRRRPTAPSAPGEPACRGRRRIPQAEPQAVGRTI